MEFDKISISKLLDTSPNQNYKLGFWEKLSLLLTSGRDDVGSLVPYFIFVAIEIGVCATKLCFLREKRLGFYLNQR